MEICVVRHMSQFFWAPTLWTLRFFSKIHWSWQCRKIFFCGAAHLRCGDWDPGIGCQWCQLMSRFVHCHVHVLSFFFLISHPPLKLKKWNLALYSQLAAPNVGQQKSYLKLDHEIKVQTSDLGDDKWRSYSRRGVEGNGDSLGHCWHARRHY